MARYVCSVCGYIHDEAEGGAFDALPASWTCPVCGAEKSQFEREGREASDAVDSPTASTLPTDADEGQDQSLWGDVRGAHRLFGYLFFAIFLILMIQMVPRLWQYQIEFPARTVVHIALGMAVGVVLLLKISIVRYFRRLDQALVPMLGTTLLVGSVVLIGISVPAALREAYVTARLFTAESQQRVKSLLLQTGLSESECTRYSNNGALREGQTLLRRECIECHDLRTVLARPRTPPQWRQTVQRMAQRTSMLNPLDENQQWLITAYLTAVSPLLQKSNQQLSERQTQHQVVQDAVDSMAQQPVVATEYDAARAEQLVQAKCSQCHEATLVADSPPDSEQEAVQLVKDMVDEGLEATRGELSLIVEYLKRTYVK